jgi:hypothetical protein
MQNIYQFSCGIAMLRWIDYLAYRKRWPRSFVVVDCIEKNIDVITQEDIDSQRIRGLRHAISNAQCSIALEEQIKARQIQFKASQGVIVRACIAKEMQKEA